MYKFKPILKSTLWGGEKIVPYKQIASGQTQVGESWELSGGRGNESIVAEGPDEGDAKFIWELPRGTIFRHERTTDLSWTGGAGKTGNYALHRELSDHRPAPIFIKNQIFTKKEWRIRRLRHSYRARSMLASGL